MNENLLSLLFQGNYLKGVSPFRSLFFRSPNITQPCPQVFSVNEPIICSGLHFWRHFDAIGSIIFDGLHFWRHWFNMAKILLKFREQQLVMMSYACGFNQSETGKYFECQSYRLFDLTYFYNTYIKKLHVSQWCCFERSHDKCRSCKMPGLGLLPFHADILTFAYCFFALFLAPLYFIFHHLSRHSSIFLCNCCSQQRSRYTYTNCDFLVLLTGVTTWSCVMKRESPSSSAVSAMWLLWVCFMNLPLWGEKMFKYYLFTFMFWKSFLQNVLILAYNRVKTHFLTDNFRM